MKAIVSIFLLILIAGFLQDCQNTICSEYEYFQDGKTSNWELCRKGRTYHLVGYAKEGFTIFDKKFSTKVGLLKSGERIEERIPGGVDNFSVQGHYMFGTGNGWKITLQNDDVRYVIRIMDRHDKSSFVHPADKYLTEPEG
jgi:hypothetical protein